MGTRNALLLASFNYRLAQRLLTDLALTPGALTPKRWRWQQSPRAERLPASKITWSGFVSAKPLPETRAFLENVPDEMVRQVLKWAPPLLQPSRANGTSFVVANFLSALLARQRFPDQVIQVRRLGHAISSGRTLPEICQGTVHVLHPVFLQHRRRIAQLAPDEATAKLLSGYSRAQYFRIKDSIG